MIAVERLVIALCRGEMLSVPKVAVPLHNRAEAVHGEDRVTSDALHKLTGSKHAQNWRACEQQS